MNRMVNFLKRFDDEGVIYLGEIIREFELECNFKYFVLNEDLEFGKWSEISEIVALDQQVNKVNVIEDVLDLLSRIKDYYIDYPNEEEYRNDTTKEMSLEFYKRKSKCYFLSEVLKNYGVE